MLADGVTGCETLEVDTVSSAAAVLLTCFCVCCLFFFTVRLHLRHFSIISSQNASGYFTVCICVCFSLLMSEERNNWIPRSYFSFIETHTCACECVCVCASHIITMLLAFWNVCVCTVCVSSIYVSACVSVCLLCLLPVCQSICCLYLSLSTLCNFHWITTAFIQRHQLAAASDCVTWENWKQKVKLRWRHWLSPL